MTLRFVDSFDDRDGTELDQKWHVNANWITVGGGRAGTNCMDLPHAAEKQFMQEHGWTVGFALYYHTDAISQFFSFWDVLDQYQLSITTLAGGLLQVASEAGAPIFGVSTAPLLFDQWQYVEIQVVCDAVAGYVIIHLDEIEVYNSGFVNTDPTGAGAIATLVFPSITTDDFIDDVYICDDNGAMNNTFLGDCHVECILPNGVGTPPTAQWVNSFDDTASLYTMVDEVPPGFDYNYDLFVAPPVKDVWSFPDIAVELNSILGVQVNCFVRREDEVDWVDMHNICRSGGADYSSITYGVSETDYIYKMSIWEQNPDGPINWLRIDFNAAEFGYEREAH